MFDNGSWKLSLEVKMDYEKMSYRFFEWEQETMDIHSPLLLGEKEKKKKISNDKESKALAKLKKKNQKLEEEVNNVATIFETSTTF